MQTQEWIMLKELKPLEERGEIITNREFFYLMKDSMPFNTQEECDDAVANIIQKGNLSPFVVVEDPIVKFSASLKAIVETSLNGKDL